MAAFSRIVVAGLVIIALSACGFHLQGADVLPPVMAATYIDAPDRYTRFYRGIHRSLSLAGASLTDVDTNASAVLTIHVDETGQRVISVSPRNIPEEFEVFYTISYSLRSAEEVLIPPQTVTLSRSYTYDETQVLAKREEEEVIRRALANDLVRMVRRRIAALK